MSGRLIVEIGVDEAGRGPFIGDMVIAGVAAPRSVFEELSRIGLKDSKAISPSRRRMLLQEIVSRGVDIAAVYVAPHLVDSSNMNRLEYTVMCSLLELLSYSHMLKSSNSLVKIYVDEVKGYGRLLEECAVRVYGGIEVHVEPDADAKYPAVSAASIVAKVFRDNGIRALKLIAGEIGSGYPSDPTSRRWLTTAYTSMPEPPVYVRRSWGLLRELAPGWYTVKHAKHSRTRSLLDYTGVSQHGDKSTG